MDSILRSWPAHISVAASLVKYGVYKIQDVVIKSVAKKTIDPYIENVIVEPFIEYAKKSHVVNSIVSSIGSNVLIQDTLLAGASVFDTIGLSIEKKVESATNIAKWGLKGASGSCHLLKSTLIILPFFLVLYYAMVNTILARQVYKNKKLVTFISLLTGTVMLAVLASNFYIMYSKQILRFIAPKILDAPLLLAMNILIFYVYGGFEIITLLQIIHTRKKENESYFMHAMHAIMLGLALVAITGYVGSVLNLYFGFFRYFSAAFSTV
ncbi:hypothetical protein NEAUS06_1098 [Nematocida ausubeli]|nr:hypothetical protein NEAUS06_1098 [Nematocida ausubeli]